ncbi:hypothetical protein OIO90_000319 [Microbotryomycetes sp. JL221]|nr:hypothetical protein OIO90_000319 [Microbotryomycetes sp. JL221]
MGVGTTSSSSTREPNKSASSHSNSNSSSSDAEGDSLTRTTSRLTYGNMPTYNPQSILVNPYKSPAATTYTPVDVEPIPSIQLPSPGLASCSPTTTTTNHRLDSQLRTSAVTVTHPTTTTTTRARSLSRESVASSSNRASSPIGAPLSSSISNDTGLVRFESYENRKIRFAPLPEITGRDDHQTGLGDDLNDGSNNNHNNSSSADLTSPQAITGIVSQDESDDTGTSRSYGSMFGSWKSETSFGGRRQSVDYDNQDQDESTSSKLSSSYTAKLLRPLGFGSNKKKKRSSSSTRSSGTDSLSRQSSNESDLSRVSSSIDGTRQPTGIPMRKTRTWESAEEATTSSSIATSLSPRQTRRSNYPPVAPKQRPRASAIRKSKMSRSAPAAPDVEFNEWGSNQGVGSVRTTSSFSRDEDEDDGSGMAWIKKRRAQREAEEKRKAIEEQEQQEAQKRKQEQERLQTVEPDDGEEEDDEEADDINGLGEDGDVPFALDEDDDVHSTHTAIPGIRNETGTERSTRTSTPQMSLTPRQNSISLQPQHMTTNTNTNTTTTSGLSLTKPTLHVQKSTPDVSPALKNQFFENLNHDQQQHQQQFDSTLVEIESPLSNSPPRSIQNQNEDDSLHAKNLSDKLGQLALNKSTSTHSTTRVIYSDEEEEDSDSDSSSGESDEEKHQDEDSDLDEDELAQEEALAEQARKTAQSAGAERFHSAKHHSSVVDVDKGRVAPSRQSTLTPANTNSIISSIISPSRQNTLTPPRQTSLSH